MARLDGSPSSILPLNDNSQEVDADMMSILNARLGAGGRYRAHPSQAPLEKGYFTLVYIRVETVEVHSSAREVSAGCCFVVAWPCGGLAFPSRPFRSRCVSAKGGERLARERLAMLLTL